MGDLGPIVYADLRRVLEGRVFEKVSMRIW